MRAVADTIRSGLHCIFIEKSFELYRAVKYFVQPIVIVICRFPVGELVLKKRFQVNHFPFFIRLYLIRPHNSMVLILSL